MATTAEVPAGIRLGRAWWMVGALFALYVLAWLDRLAVSMLVAPIKARLALTDFEMSLVLGPSFALSYAIFGIPLGWAADRFSRRLVIFCGVFVWATASLACAFATSFESLMACRVFVGIGEAALFVGAVPVRRWIIHDAMPESAAVKVDWSTPWLKVTSRFVTLDHAGMAVAAPGCEIDAPFGAALSVA